MLEVNLLQGKACRGKIIHHSDDSAADSVFHFMMIMREILLVPRAASIRFVSVSKAHYLSRPRADEDILQEATAGAIRVFYFLSCS